MAISTFLYLGGTRITWSFMQRNRRKLKSLDEDFLDKGINSCFWMLMYPLEVTNGCLKWTSHMHQFADGQVYKNPDSSFCHSNDRCDGSQQKLTPMNTFQYDNECLSRCNWRLGTKENLLALFVMTDVSSLISPLFSSDASQMEASYE